MGFFLPVSGGIKARDWGAANVRFCSESGPFYLNQFWPAFIGKADPFSAPRWAISDGVGRDMEDMIRGNRAKYQCHSFSTQGSTSRGPEVL